ncbi:MAG: sigma-70 family RNA polymerase sigma factor [Anaerolineales bacterium]|nr:sigma-70 family RNA polymerase sigma factor [Anaerolineales bacterium]
MSELEIPEKIAQAQQGDSIALSDLYQRYHAGVYRYLFYRVGDLHAAEDLASEVFVRMIASLEGYRPLNGSFEAWLYQIARNLAIDHLRKMSLRDHRALEEEMVAEQDDVSKTVESRLTSDVLARALRKLNDTQRDVIVLRFVNCLSVAQVAHTLHKSEDSIKSLQRRGLESLRKILKEWEISYV